MNEDTTTQIKGEEIGLKEKSILTITAHPGEEAVPIAVMLTEYLSDAMSDIQDASADLNDLKRKGDSSETAKRAEKAAFEQMEKGVDKLMKAIPSDKILTVAKRVLKHSQLCIFDEEDKARTVNFSDSGEFSTFFTRNVAALPHLMRESISFNNFLGYDPTVLVFSPRIEEEMKAAEKAAEAMAGSQSA